MDDNGNEKTMMIPVLTQCLFLTFSELQLRMPHRRDAVDVIVCSHAGLRERLELAEDPQGEASELSAPGHLHGIELVGIAQLF